MLVQRFHVEAMLTSRTKERISLRYKVNWEICLLISSKTLAHQLKMLFLQIFWIFWTQQSIARFSQDLELSYQHTARHWTRHNRPKRAVVFHLNFCQSQGEHESCVKPPASFLVYLQVLKATKLQLTWPTVGFALASSPLPLSCAVYEGRWRQLKLPASVII